MGVLLITALLEKVVAERLLQTLAEFQQDQPEVPKKPRKAGSAKGLLWIAPDFDEPLEDFKNYM